MNLNFSQAGGEVHMIAAPWAARRVSTVRNAGTTETESVTVGALLKGIQSGRWQKPVEAVRAAVAAGDDKTKERLKKALPGALFSGTFTKRANEFLKEHSGTLALDFDHLDGALSDARAKLQADPHTAALFTSPSGTGLKALVLIPADPELHRSAYETAARHYADMGLTVDPAPSAPASLCFVSYDPDLFTRSDPKPFTVTKPKPKPAPPRSLSGDIPARAKVENALRYISADCDYETWLRVGMALHEWTPGEGLNVWDSWSRGAPGRYEEGACDRHWKTFSTGGGVTIATVFDLAKAGGWRPAGPPATNHRGGADTDAAPTWAAVIPFDAPAILPAMPVEVLPDPFKSFVMDVSASKQVPPDLPGALVLGAVALAAAKRWRVYVGQSHDEPLNLFLLALMDPGSRKSDTFRACLAPVEDCEITLACEAGPEIARAKERRAVEEARLTELRRRAGRADDPEERRNLTREAETLAASLTEIPNPPRLLAGDVSPEHLATLLCVNGGRMAVADAEGGLVFEIMGGRYSKGGAPNIEVFLKGHAGDAVRVDRTGRPADFARSAALTCILTAQPCILRNLTARDHFRGRGLLARFLFSMPAGLIGTRTYNNRPMNPGLVEQYAARLRALLAVQPASLNDPEDHRRLILDGEALGVWRTFHDRIEAAQAPDRDLSHLTDFASKLPGAAARLAGIMHLMKHGPEGPMMIAPDTAAGAWALALYFLDHAKAVFSELTAGGDMDLARRIHGWILRNRPERFTLGRLFDDLRRGAGVEMSDNLLPGLNILEDRNVVRREPDPPGTRPGRKSFGTWEVNPAVLGEA